MQTRAVKREGISACVDIHSVALSADFKTWWDCASNCFQSASDGGWLQSALVDADPTTVVDNKTVVPEGLLYFILNVVV